MRLNCCFCIGCCVFAFLRLACAYAREMVRFYQVQTKLALYVGAGFDSRKSPFEKVLGHGLFGTTGESFVTV